jgi:hypothetical protein
VLERHPNRDVRAKYLKTIQEWIPTKMLTRFRITVYNRIVQGKFDNIYFLFKVYLYALKAEQ